MVCKTYPVDYIKPRRVRIGDTVAVISTSWGGPHVFPHIFDKGISNLRDLFGLRIKEYASTRMSPSELTANPRQLNGKNDGTVGVLSKPFGDNDIAPVLDFLVRYRDGQITPPPNNLTLF